MKLSDYSTEQLEQFHEEINKAYEDFKARGLKLDLTRGKPSAEQLDFSSALGILPGDSADRYVTGDGVDTRNYGGLNGISDIRAIYGELLGIDPSLVIAGDSSSLNIMFDLISFAYIWGTQDSPRPWKDEETVKWLCPVPGYDRHFTITEHFGFEMITVPMTDDGPDMDVVAQLVKDDPSIKGMWCVPVFGNPTGITFSKKVCEQIAAMPTAADDFRVVWDNAYVVHTLTDQFPEVHNVIDMAARAGNPNRFWFMTSTSKITFAGSGVSFFASSKANLDWYTAHASVRGIGPNKVNQLAHARFFGDADGVKAHMKKHAGSLAPKFQMVLSILDNRLTEYGVASWTKPEGGYFISLDVVDGTASTVVDLAKQAGIALTGAGSSFPLHKDPDNRNIRLAPSLPPVAELELAMNGVATCVLLAACEHYLGKA
ncbi:aminotransferase class I/II-fold pyridoxal phosphate-dependent enzyme [Corynebacterium mendelii]|uniref:Aminotransferase class I/II-fold pyridoxal phosphate-dependent enzyme n=1 Tax=Corynebacterium mendelii TaxID=2765362 RepID=A0A939E0R7_9CORY|nr:aminotransferase class I/II-fold pyridoxal phosphate-dependent enzyme [Corynebacterium mendelii]MBN9643728.1 aminotransferase class I/II-fold pyridoxal phosphate-dependent enzyme [Corynebacterium mendelii]